jgi:hypothetical protein
MLLVGMALVLIAGAVAYFQTDLRNYVPLGVAIAVLLLMGGIFVFALSSQFRSSRIVEERYADSTLRPATTNTTIVRDRDRPSRRYDDQDVTEIETVRAH